MAFWRRRSLDLAKLENELRRRAERGDRAGGLALAKEALVDHPDSVELLVTLGVACQHLTDIDDLNAAPPDDLWFAALVARLERLAAVTTARDERVRLLEALATAGRRLGRRGDAIAERAHAEHVALCPDVWQAHHDQGLFWKTRARFAEGQRAHQRAAELGGADYKSVQWNLAICATGAGDGATALRAWRRLDQQVELGRFGLPDGTYPIAKVRLAERPLAERGGPDAPDTPGLEENVAVQRLSPCHGIIRCDAIGLQLGDVVLFDGAAVGYEHDGAERIPIFPHLATLRRSTSTSA